jgi:hypothetical protein
MPAPDLTQAMNSLVMLLRELLESFSQRLIVAKPRFDFRHTRLWQRFVEKGKQYRIIQRILGARHGLDHPVFDD